MKMMKIHKLLVLILVVAMIVPTVVYASEVSRRTEVSTLAATEMEATPEEPMPEPTPEPTPEPPAEEEPMIPLETNAPDVETETETEVETDKDRGAGEPVEIPETEVPRQPDDVNDGEWLRDKDAALNQPDVDYIPDEHFTTSVKPDQIKDNFRFRSVTKVSALVKEDNTRVYGDYRMDKTVIGVMDKDTICNVLIMGNGIWSYIESGDVRGFVSSRALEISRDIDTKIRLQGEPTFRKAKALVSPRENPAYLFERITAGPTVVKKEYAIVQGGGALNIYEERNTESRIIGTLVNGGLCYVLAQTMEWVYIESGDARGFVAAEHLLMGEEAKTKVETLREANFPLAEEFIPPEENAACYYTFTSVKEPQGGVLQYLGNFTVTAYCSCPVCCGPWSGGPTASGLYPVEGRTIAMGGIPFGTKLVIDGNIYTVEDRGTPYGHVDIYMISHSAAVIFGRQRAEVYVFQETE